VADFCKHNYETPGSHKMREIYWLADGQVSFSRRSLFHGVSLICLSTLANHKKFQRIIRKLCYN